MKTLILVLFLFVFGSNPATVGQKRDSTVLYKQLLEFYFKNVPKYVPEDTFLVWKADYLPPDLPDLINNHYIKFLSEKEIDNYNGRLYPMIKLSQIKPEGLFYKIDMRTFRFDKKQKTWISPAISEYNFHYDIQKQKFSLIGPVITK